MAVITDYVLCQCGQDGGEPLVHAHGHGHAGVAQRRDLEVQILLQQLQTVEGEEDLGLVTQRSRSGSQDEGRISPVQRPLGCNDGKLLFFHRISLFIRG